MLAAAASTRTLTRIRRYGAGSVGCTGPRRPRSVATVIGAVVINRPDHRAGPAAASSCVVVNWTDHGSASFAICPAAACAFARVGRDCASGADRTGLGCASAAAAGSIVIYRTDHGSTFARG